MLTFFAALCHKVPNSLSLKFSVSEIIDNTETVGADSQRTNVGNMKIINNCMDPPNIQ